MLSRFAQILPGARMPDGPEEFSRLPSHVQLDISSRDPLLYALLTETATAADEAAARSGSISPDPPPIISPQQKARQEAEQWVEENGSPWGKPGSYDPAGNFTPPTPPNWTQQLLIQQNHPELAARLEQQWLEQHPAADPAAIAEQQRQQQLQDQEARRASLIRAGAVRA